MLQVLRRHRRSARRVRVLPGARPFAAGARPASAFGQVRPGPSRRPSSLRAALRARARAAGTLRLA
eukprot:6063947-Alexandrium_andersonii.AAC.1